MRSEQEIMAELQGLLGSDPSIAGGPAPSVDMNQPIPTEMTQATGRGSSTKYVIPASKKIINEMTANDANAKELGQQKSISDLATNEMMGLLGNLTSNLKAANIEAGGAGPFKGALANIAVGLGLDNTGNIYGLKGTVRDTAIKMAQRLSGGNRGAQTIFQKVLESIPTNLNSEGQQASTINDMAHTALSLQKAVDNIGIDNITKMKPAELHDAIAANALDPNESDQITQAVSAMLQTTKPRPSLDMNGNIKEPQTNKLSGSVFGTPRQDLAHLSDDELKKMAGLK